jgi:CDP-diacylglycerol--serine O-phosphatidyltransferase
MIKYFPALKYVNIPNLLTTLGLCFGIAAFYFVSENNFKLVLICLFFSSFMDLIDGFSAVKLNKQTPFGIYADTLVDFFICCIMPVVITYTFLGNGLLLMCGIGFYCVCGLWRLANYIVLTAENQTHFSGLPVPGAMLIVTMTIWSAARYDIPAWSCAAVFCLTGLLMLSSVRLKKYGLWQISLGVICLAFLAAVLFIIEA